MVEVDVGSPLAFLFEGGGGAGGADIINAACGRPFVAGAGFLLYASSLTLKFS